MYTPPRILVISQVPPPTHGSTLMTLALLNGLRGEGLEPRLLDRRFSRSVAEVGAASPRKILAIVGLLFRLQRDLILFRPTQVVFFCTNRPASFLIDWVISEILRANSVRVINYVHTQGFKSLASRSRIWRLLVRRLLGAAQKTVCLSATLERDVAEFVPDEQRISIPNTTDHPGPAPDSPHGKPASERPRALFLSNLLPEKGAETFVRLAVEYLDRGYLATFDIVGAFSDEIYLKSLRRQISDSGHGEWIVIRGPASRDAAWNYLRSARVLVFPSTYRYEAQPLTIVEALAAGTPPVAYGTGGIGDLIVDGLTGFVLKPGDYEGLSRQFMEVMNHEGLRERLSEAASMDFEERFSRNAYMTAWMRLLTS